MTPRRLVSAAVRGGLVPLALAACAGPGAYPRMPAPESLPANSPLLSQSLGRTDAWLRRYVMEGKPDSAVQMLDAASKVRPRDELVRQLQLGLVYTTPGSGRRATPPSSGPRRKPSSAGRRASPGRPASWC